MKASISGVTTGPPADRECAVDPEGVDMIKPSLLYVVTSFPFIYNLIETSLDRDDLEITASFNPEVFLMVWFERIISQVNNILCEMVYSPANIFSRV
jgi:hypothetical protein